MLGRLRLTAKRSHWLLARPPTHRAWQYPRAFSAALADDVIRKIDDINEQFAEARDEIEFAREEEGTVYYEEEVMGANKLAEECVAAYNDLLASLSEEDKGQVQRSMGLKMAQLKAETAQLMEELIHSD